MKIKEIVAKKDKDLTADLSSLSDKLVKARFEVAARETNKFTEIKALKKDIARVKTILKEREIQREEEKNEENV